MDLLEQIKKQIELNTGNGLKEPALKLLRIIEGLQRENELWTKQNKLLVKNNVKYKEMNQQLTDKLKIAEEALERADDSLTAFANKYADEGMRNVANVLDDISEGIEGALSLIREVNPDTEV